MKPARSFFMLLALAGHILQMVFAGAFVAFTVLNLARSFARHLPAFVTVMFVLLFAASVVLAALAWRDLIEKIEE